MRSTRERAGAFNIHSTSIKRQSIQHTPSSERLAAAEAVALNESCRSERRRASEREGAQRRSLSSSGLRWLLGGCKWVSCVALDVALLACGLLSPLRRAVLLLPLLLSARRFRCSRASPLVAAAVPLAACAALR